jgi:lysophospholipase L1-like esterase
VLRIEVDKIALNPAYSEMVDEYYYLNTEYRHNNAIVFVGDSITKRFNTYEFFAGTQTINRGILSDTTHGLLSRLEKNINNIDIEKIFIMIGYNDLKYRDNEQIVTNVFSIVKNSKAKGIFVQSILPIKFSEKVINKRIDDINEKLKSNAAALKYTFIDLNSLFKKSDCGIDGLLTGDGVHPNHLGYALWYRAIEQYL